MTIPTETRVYMLLAGGTKFEDTVASKCRWSEYAEEYFDSSDGWIVIWDGSYSDYQGEVCLLGYNVQSGCFRIIEYGYGSCSGCDGFEDMSDADRRYEFKKLTMTFDTDEEARTFFGKILGGSLAPAKQAFYQFTRS